MIESTAQKTATWMFPQEIQVRGNGSVHFALFQDDIDIKADIAEAFKDHALQFHTFSDSRELIRCCKRYPLDMIVIGFSHDFKKVCRMVNQAKEQMFLSIIPLVLYSPNPPKDIYERALECEADELLIGEWNHPGFDVRLKMMLKRSQRDLGVNPSSRLPGPSMIENRINNLIAKDREFAVCYLDIDNFKAYNDYYGYFYGDKVIRLTAQIVRDIVFDLVPDGFIGHIGGDDFVFIIPYEEIEIVCTNVIKTFDRIIPYKYKTIDRECGKIVTKNRFEEEEVFSILTISIAVLVCQNGVFSHAGEMSHMLADLKKYTKKLAGSNFMIERRKKY